MSSFSGSGVHDFLLVSAPAVEDEHLRRRAGEVSRIRLHRRLAPDIQVRQDRRERGLRLGMRRARREAADHPEPAPVCAREDSDDPGSTELAIIIGTNTSETVPAWSP
jgi:hypothetical protein